MDFCTNFPLPKQQQKICFFEDKLFIFIACTKQRENRNTSNNNHLSANARDELSGAAKIQNCIHERKERETKSFNRSEHKKLLEIVSREVDKVTFLCFFFCFMNERKKLSQKTIFCGLTKAEKCCNFVQ
jgi:uncharacterized protein YktB (UPF0637 family)